MKGFQVGGHDDVESFVVTLAEIRQLRVTQAFFTEPKIPFVQGLSGHGGPVIEADDFDGQLFLGLHRVFSRRDGATKQERVITRHQFV